jgi:hypothetical protein
LSVALGESYAVGLPEGRASNWWPAETPHERIADLDQRGFELGEQLARKDAELEAVRQLSWELMAKVSISRA